MDSNNQILALFKECILDLLENQGVILERLAQTQGIDQKEKNRFLMAANKSFARLKELEVTLRALRSK